MWRLDGVVLRGDNRFIETGNVVAYECFVCDLRRAAGTNCVEYL